MAQNRTREVVMRSLDHSLCFGLYHENRQIGLARIITDYATFAYLCDVYIADTYRGQGLGTWLLSVVMAYPSLQGLRRWLLVTLDAHTFYESHGFTSLENSERWMGIANPAV